MQFEEFEGTARRMWREIPPEFKAGVEGLVLERRARPHPDLPEIYTLGECLTESYPSSYEGPDTLRSRVVLYYGSFLRLSRLDRDFDWQEEIWETLTHEVRHHLESLADEDALEDVDYAADENFKRGAGEGFDPYFFRQGEPIEEDVYSVEGDVFIEREQAAAGHDTVEFTLGRSRYRVPAPGGDADVWFVRLTSGVEARGEAFLVLTRRPGLMESMRGLLTPRAARVRESDAVAERL